MIKGQLRPNPDSDRITVRCPCGAKLKLPAAAAGRKGRCPKCKEVFTVPDSPAPAKHVEPAAQPAREPAEGLSAFAELAQQEDTAVAKSSPDLAKMIARCPECDTAIAGNATLCVQCGYNIATGKQTKAASARAANASAAARKLATGAGGFALGCILSAGGALIGAALWAGIAIATEYEIGWIACILGGLTGGGMVLGYREQNFRAGVVAAGIAVLGIAAARLILVLFVMSVEISDFVETREFKEYVLTAHLAAVKSWEQNLAPWEQDEWEKLYDRTMNEDVNPLDKPEFEQAWESFETWSSYVKWEDEEFVRIFLVNRLARQGLPDELGDEPPMSLKEWEQRCRTAAAEVDAMATEERVKRAKEIKVENEVDLDVHEVEASLKDIFEDAYIQGAQEEIPWTELFVDDPMDVLFIVLALVAAFKLASGTGDDD